MERVTAPGGVREPPEVTPRGTVLVVEDDEVLRPLLLALLEDAGWKTVAVGGGEEAFAYLASEEAALLLIDANISRPSCSEFLRTLNRTFGGRRPPTLIVIMPGQATLREGLRLLGAGAFLSEPFDRDELLALVADHARQETATETSPA